MDKIKKMIIRITLVSILTLCFQCIRICAEEDSAVLSAIIGNVEVLASGTNEWVKATDGMKLTPGDKIRTNLDGMASIAFSNGSLITLKQNTEFEIKSLDASKDKKDIDYRLKLTMGKLRALVENLNEESSFEIETPTAVAAVRGTLFYLFVSEASEEELSQDVKERLKTELFVEEDGVLYTNSITGKYFKVFAGKSSSSFSDGNITEPIDIPEDKQQEWKQGWEDILAAEPYKLPEGTTVQDLTLAGGGGEGENTSSDRQSDQASQYTDDSQYLVKKALEASEKANEAAILAHQAESNTLKAKNDIDNKNAELNSKEEEIKTAYDEAVNSKNEASDYYSLVKAKVLDTQQAINKVQNDIKEEEEKISGFVIVGINTLRGKFDNMQTMFNNLSNNVEDVGSRIDGLTDLLSGNPPGTNSLAERLNQAYLDVGFWAEKAEDLANKLLMAASNAHIEGNDAAIEALRVLIEATLTAIDRANQAANEANKAAEEAENLLVNVPSLLEQANQVVTSLEGIASDAQKLTGDFQAALLKADDLAGGGEALKNDILSLVTAHIQHEKDVVWQEMNRKLREQQFLRQEIRRILEANQERRVEGYIEKISDAQTGKVLMDIHGNRVRVEQYVLRPDSNTVELLNVNLRAGDDLTVLNWSTKFNNNKSLDLLPSGQLKTLPWDSYLDTKWGWTEYINSPDREDGIYPEEMRVGFSHNVDGFTESRKFAKRENSRQTIYDKQLIVNNFNGSEPMDYKYNQKGPQPDGTFSITAKKMNAEIDGAENNPKGFSYNFANKTGEQGIIEAAFYVVSDDGVRQDGFDSIRMDDIWSALKVNMGLPNANIGNNNMEMRFSSSLAVFQCGPIDLVYIPFDRLDWKGDDHIPFPPYSSPPAE